jgi:CheY-like chemotaxis protein
MEPVIILLVDDEASVLQLVEHALTDAEFRVRTVSDGRQAIQFLGAGAGSVRLRKEKKRARQVPVQILRTKGRKAGFREGTT